jgi:hypothetical protein
MENKDQEVASLYELIKNEYEKSILDYQQVFKSTRKGDPKRKGLLFEIEILKNKVFILERKVNLINQKKNERHF